MDQDQYIECLRAALQFYATGGHLLQGFEDFETVSGEPENILCSETVSVEDGSFAKAILDIPVEDPHALERMQRLVKVIRGEEDEL